MKPELMEYLRNKAKSEFDEVNNHCVQFTNDCWEIYYGFPYCEKYNKMSRMSEAGFTEPLDLFDSVLERSEKPQEGHLVAISSDRDTQLHGLAIGFCVGDLSVFLSTNGVKYIPTKRVEFSWGNKRSLNRKNKDD